MKIIVDTNIVFSALLNTSKGIGKILLTSNQYLQFYTCQYLRTELHNHSLKLKKLTKLSDDELEQLIDLILKNITTIHEDIIPKSQFIKAFELTKDIDPSDTPFLALAIHLKGRLWTGDNKLVKGLQKKDCIVPITSAELQELLNKLRK